jgi:hypothetical protein
MQLALQGRPAFCDSLDGYVPPRTEDAVDPLFVNEARIGWRWLLWRRLSHKNRTQRLSKLATP